MILGIDVGGTHTDSVLMKGRKIIRKSKVLTDKENILNCVMMATEAVAKPEDIKNLERIVLSTTLTTNAVVQNQLAPVGLVVMNGPGVSPKDLPLYDKANYVAGYMSHRGIEAESPDRSELAALKDKFRKEKINRLAIVGKFSTRNPAHEQEVSEVFRDVAEHASQSHQLSGSLNFPRRIATTYLNEAVWHLQDKLANELKTYMDKLGVNVPLYILKADGGTIEFEQSRKTPVQTILSGPAATIMGVLPYVSDEMDSISVDIGGTTTDIALFADGVPLLEPQGITIEDHKTSVRGLLTHSIGVGGDSHVRVEDGVLKLGPERLGAAMAFDGPVPTTTDALIVLGIADIGDKAKAMEAMKQLAAELKKTPEEVAKDARSGLYADRGQDQCDAHRNQQQAGLYDSRIARRPQDRTAGNCGGWRSGTVYGKTYWRNDGLPGQGSGGFRRDQRQRCSDSQNDGGIEYGCRYRSANPEHRRRGRPAGNLQTVYTG